MTGSKNLKIIQRLLKRLFNNLLNLFLVNKSILFFSEGLSFLLKNKKKIREWIIFSVQLEKKEPGDINYIFCSDEYLHNLNIKYLNHDTYTDIITFNYSENTCEISGEIYISIERVKENAQKYKATFPEELYRVMIHGVLHLLGYKDKTRIDAQIMRDKEDYYLSLLPKFIA